MWKELFVCYTGYIKYCSHKPQQMCSAQNQSSMYRIPFSNLNNAFSAPNIWTVDDGCLAKFRSDPVIEHSQVEAKRQLNFSRWMSFFSILVYTTVNWYCTRIYMQRLISLLLHYQNFTRTTSQSFWILITPETAPFAFYDWVCLWQPSNNYCSVFYTLLNCQNDVKTQQWRNFHHSFEQ